MVVGTFKQDFQSTKGKSVNGSIHPTCLNVEFKGWPSTCSCANMGLSNEMDDTQGALYPSEYTAPNGSIYPKCGETTFVTQKEGSGSGGDVNVHIVPDEIAHTTDAFSTKELIADSVPITTWDPVDGVSSEKSVTDVECGTTISEHKACDLVGHWATKEAPLTTSDGICTFDCHFTGMSEATCIVLWEKPTNHHWIYHAFS